MTEFLVLVGLQGVSDKETEAFLLLFNFFRDRMSLSVTQGDSVKFSSVGNVSCLLFSLTKAFGSSGSL